MKHKCISCKYLHFGWPPLGSCRSFLPLPDLFRQAPKREDVGLGSKSAPPEVILQPDQASPAMDCLRSGFRGNTAAGERSGSSVITHEALLITGMRRARQLVASPPPEPPAHSVARLLRLSRSPLSTLRHAWHAIRQPLVAKTSELNACTHYSVPDAPEMLGRS